VANVISMAQLYIEVSSEYTRYGSSKVLASSFEEEAEKGVWREKKTKSVDEEERSNESFLQNIVLQLMKKNIAYFIDLHALLEYGSANMKEMSYSAISNGDSNNKAPSFFFLDEAYLNTLAIPQLNRKYSALEEWLVRKRSCFLDDSDAASISCDERQKLYSLPEVLGMDMLIDRMLEANSMFYTTYDPRKKLENSDRSTVLNAQQSDLQRGRLNQDYLLLYILIMFDLSSALDEFAVLLFECISNEIQMSKLVLIVLFAVGVLLLIVGYLVGFIPAWKIVKQELYLNEFLDAFGNEVDGNEVDDVDIEDMEVLEE
jgi:hypothetical protein